MSIDIINYLSVQPEVVTHLISQGQADTAVYSEVGLFGMVTLAQLKHTRDGRGVCYIVANTREKIVLERYLDSLGVSYAVAEGKSLQYFLPKVGTSSVLVFDAQTLLAPVQSSEQYHQSTLTLHLQEVVSHDFFDRLTVIGYERVDHMDRPGQYTKRGEIVEIWGPINRIRIALYDQMIEKIWEVSAMLDQKQELSSSRILPWNVAGESMVMEYLSDYVWNIYNKESVQSEMIRFVQGESVELTTAHSEILYAIEKAMQAVQTAYFEPFSVAGYVRLAWQEPALSLKAFAPAAALGLPRSKVICVTSKIDSLKRLLLENEIGYSELSHSAATNSRVVLIEGELAQGLDMGPGLPIVLSTADIFGSRRSEQKKKRKKSVDFSQLVSLKAGEYVVHIDHGVGRFTGFGTIVVDGITREYIYIEYEKGDQIFVPLDQADKITKYITVGNESPKLSSLATNHWEKVRAKVKRDTEEIARELLEVQAMRVSNKTFHYVDDTNEQRQASESFHYTLTPDQAKAVREVLENMEGERPMDRLLCGDVGYGKTEVAVRAALKAVVSGGQVAVLVPTTILAEQHVQTFMERLDQFGIRVASLSRFVSKETQREALKKLKDGQIDVMIGTHRLLSRDVVFKNLALVVIDEEQKFGVKHKENLKALRSGVDILTMTATPIPRTLYFGLSGLKEISLIQTAPEGRLPVRTFVIRKSDEVLVDAVRQEIARGGQLYIVHNRVETIEAFAYKISQLVPEMTYRVAHGQMDEGRLATIINDFARGEFVALICSTIIESGLDISRVNTMIVDRATNFGLSQLHQLRGRIGRGNVQAFAYFLYSQEDLVGNAQRRLESILKKGDLGSGYELSLEDLDIRGSGNILGREQSGNMQLVGVGYYMKMLEEAVEKMKEAGSGVGQDIAVPPVKIDLAVDAYIPADYYDNEDDKIKAYQALAQIEDEEELDQFVQREVDVHESLPHEYTQLVEIARLKIRARQCNIASIVSETYLDMAENKRRRIAITLTHDISPHERANIAAISNDWQFVGRVARVEERALGEQWLAKLLLMLQFLSS